MHNTGAQEMKILCKKLPVIYRKMVRSCNFYVMIFLSHPVTLHLLIFLIFRSNLYVTLVHVCIISKWNL